MKFGPIYWISHLHWLYETEEFTESLSHDRHHYPFYEQLAFGDVIILVVVLRLITLITYCLFLAADGNIGKGRVGLDKPLFRTDPYDSVNKINKIVEAQGNKTKIRNGTQEFEDSLWIN